MLNLNLSYANVLLLYLHEAKSKLPCTFVETAKGLKESHLREFTVMTGFAVHQSGVAAKYT